MTERTCQCPDIWNEFSGGGAPCYFDECPYYESCRSGWDPPCGGCDSCMWAQMCYYDEDGYWKWVCERMHFWSKLQAACA